LTDVGKLAVHRIADNSAVLKGVANRHCDNVKGQRLVRRGYGVAAGIRTAVHRSHQDTGTLTRPVIYDMISDHAYPLSAGRIADPAHVPGGRTEVVQTQRVWPDSNYIVRPAVAPFVRHLADNTVTQRSRVNKEEIPDIGHRIVLGLGRGRGYLRRDYQLH